LALFGLRGDDSHAQCVDCPNVRAQETGDAVQPAGSDATSGREEMSWLNFGSEVVRRNTLPGFFLYKHVDEEADDGYDGHELLESGQECECKFVAPTEES